MNRHRESYRCKRNSPGPVNQKRHSQIRNPHHPPPPSGWRTRFRGALMCSGRAPEPGRAAPPWPRRRGATPRCGKAGRCLAPPGIVLRERPRRAAECHRRTLASGRPGRVATSPSRQQAHHYSPPNRKRHLQPRIDSCRRHPPSPGARAPPRHRLPGKPGAPAQSWRLAAPHDSTHLLQTPGKHEPNEPAAGWSTNLLLQGKFRTARRRTPARSPAVPPATRSASTP